MGNLKSQDWTGISVIAINHLKLIPLFSIDSPDDQDAFFRELYETVSLYTKQLGLFRVTETVSIGLVVLNSFTHQDSDIQSSSTIIENIRQLQMRYNLLMSDEELPEGIEVLNLTDGLARLSQLAKIPVSGLRKISQKQPKQYDETAIIQ